jgi:hypothetical protein
MGDAYQLEVQDTTDWISSHLISAVASAECPLSPLSCLTVSYLWYRQYMRKMTD